MRDKLEKIRLMMSEQRYIEAQQLLEQTPGLTTSKELLGLLIDIHLLQGSFLPYELTINLLHLLQDEPHESLALLNKLSISGIRSQIYEIKALEKLGDLDSLYQKISHLYLFLYQRKIPRIFEEVNKIRKKYFPSDYTLELRELVLKLDRGWSEEARDDVKRIIENSFTDFNFKNKKEKFIQLEEILKSLQLNNELVIYTHLLELYNHGITAKSDYKKLIELIIFFEDIPMQAVVLNLIDHLALTEIVDKYAQIIKSNKAYSYIYFEKYFPHLKSFFVNRKVIAKKTEVLSEEIDLTLEGIMSEASAEDWIDDSAKDADEAMAEGLKQLDYEISSWLNLAVGFIQSDFSKSSLICAKKVKEAAENDTDFLKGSYLAVHALMKLRDYRMALDYCYEAIERSTLETDILSFSYMEVELLIQLKEKSSALRVLESIQEIDNTYRLSSRMLKRLNEI